MRGSSGSSSKRCERFHSGVRFAASRDSGSSPLPASPGEDHLGASGEPLFDEAALTRLGIDPRDATLLHERWEQFEMEKLYLVDAATREGWLRKPRLSREIQAARAALQEELGDLLPQDPLLLLHAGHVRGNGSQRRSGNRPRQPVPHFQHQNDPLVEPQLVPTRSMEWRCWSGEHSLGVLLGEGGCVGTTPATRPAEAA